MDIIRHESQSNSLPYWPYSASDNVGNAGNSYPDHIISNASIQQISFQSRYNAVEPEEVEIRLWENIANGSGLDSHVGRNQRSFDLEIKSTRSAMSLSRLRSRQHRNAENVRVYRRQC